MKKVILMSLLSFLFGLIGCNAKTNKFKTVDVKEFAKVIANPSVVRLDVRTAEEYAQGHIDGSILIDVLQDDFERKALATLPKGKTIALYCRSGNRSKRAAAILAAKNYKVIELATGYNGWVKGE